MRIEAAPVQLPQGHRPPRPTIPVRERVNRLEAVMQDRGTEHRRMSRRLPVPPLQQFEHQPGHVLRRWRHKGTHPHPDRAVASRFALVHDVACDDGMEAENVFVAHPLPGGLLFNMSQRGEVVEHLTPRPSGCVHGTAFLQRPNLAQGERVSLDGRRAVRVAGSRVLPQRRDPRHLHRGPLDPLPQRRDAFRPPQQGRGDGELRLIAHLADPLPESTVGQV